MQRNKNAWSKKDYVSGSAAVEYSFKIKEILHCVAVFCVLSYTIKAAGFPSFSSWIFVHSVSCVYLFVAYVFYWRAATNPRSWLNFI